MANNMAKNYNVDRIVMHISRNANIRIQGLTIEAETNEGLGNKTWGKIDFLPRNGYSLELV